MGGVDGGTGELDRSVRDGVFVGFILGRPRAEPILPLSVYALVSASCSFAFFLLPRPLPPLIFDAPSAFIPHLPSSPPLPPLHPRPKHPQLHLPKDLHNNLHPPLHNPPNHSLDLTPPVHVVKGLMLVSSASGWGVESLGERRRRCWRRTLGGYPEIRRRYSEGPSSCVQVVCGGSIE